jgi:hypothetical protein
VVTGHFSVAIVRLKLEGSPLTQNERVGTVSIDGHTKGAPWYFEKSRLKLVVFKYR